MNMRNTKVYSITMPPELAKQAERLAKKESRTMSELMREAFRRYQLQEATKPATLTEALALLRSEARAKGLDKLTKQYIDKAVAAVSYTHLDVYKRQHQDIKSVEKTAESESKTSPEQQRRLKRMDIEDKLRELDRLEAEAQKTARDDEDRIRPVSYTHLMRREELAGFD